MSIDYLETIITFAVEESNLFTTLWIIIRSVMLCLSFGNLRIFKCITSEHDGSHAIAWAAIIISLYRVSQGLQMRKWCIQCHASFTD